MENDYEEEDEPKINHKDSLLLYSQDNDDNSISDEDILFKENHIIDKRDHKEEVKEVQKTVIESVKEDDWKTWINCFFVQDDALISGSLKLLQFHRSKRFESLRLRT